MKIILSIILISSLLLLSCGDTKVINGKEYGTVGLFTKDKMDKNIEYDVIVGNVIWGSFCIYTIFIPVYFFGFSMYEPVGKKQLTKGEQQ